MSFAVPASLRSSLIHSEGFSNIPGPRIGRTSGRGYKNESNAQITQTPRVFRRTDCVGLQRERGIVRVAGRTELFGAADG